MALSEQSPTEPVAGRPPTSRQRLLNATEVYCGPWSECWITASGRRCIATIFGVSRARSVKRWVAIAHPTMRWLTTSGTTSLARVGMNPRRATGSSRTLVDRPDLAVQSVFVPGATRTPLVMKRLRRTLELHRYIPGYATRPHQLHHLTTVLRSVRPTSFSHRDVSPAQSSGVHEIGATPTNT